LKERRVGHAGTLDPMATGLLVLGVGPATRLLRFAQSETKHYTGTVQFGVATDSLDADGAVIATAPVPTVTPDLLAPALAALTGDIEQVPPMVSALKVNGKRLHELAREGVEVERQPRPVTITSFALNPTSDPTRWDFDVVCSVGTYVRVLLADLAVSLGTLGHLVALRREASGSHSAAQAWTLERLAEAVERGDHVLEAPAAFVSGLAKVTLGEDDVRRLRLGQRPRRQGEDLAGEVAALDTHGNLVAIVRARGDAWQPELVMADYA
jgi:tRNA pseudouridine55 synthase